MKSKPFLLVTGATGALGYEVCQRLGQQFEQGLILGRRAPTQLPAGWQFKFCDLAMLPQNYHLFAQHFAPVTHVLHMAADVRWHLSDEAALKINTHATQALVQSVRRYSPHLKQMIYVSTAYVDEVSCPKNKTEPDARAGFNNSYEYSKYLAEQMIQDSDVPWTIIRPSIIVGRSQDGFISHFNGLYQLLAWWIDGMLPFVLGKALGKVDIVPVDLVAESIQWALQSPQNSLNQVVYCSSGEHALTLQALVHLLDSDFKKRHQQELPSLSIVEPRIFQRLYLPMLQGKLTPAYKKQLHLFKFFMPYLSITTARHLGENPTAFICRAPKDALNVCFDYWWTQQTAR